MGVGPAAGAQAQDDVKRTGALRRDREILGTRFTGTEIQISAGTCPSEVLQSAVVCRRAASFCLRNSARSSKQLQVQSRLSAYHSTRIGYSVCRFSVSS